MTPTAGPESILAILAQLAMSGQPGADSGAPTNPPNPQTAQEGSAVGQQSPQSIVPQLLQQLVAQQPGKAQPAGQARSPNPQATPGMAPGPSPQFQGGGQQEPVGLQVLRMLGMVR